MDVLNRAFKAFFEGKIEEAESIVNRLKKRLKRSYRLWLLDSLIKLRKNEIDSALESINLGLSLKDDEAELWVVKGNILTRLGRNEEALRAYEKAYQITLEKDDYSDYEVLIEIAKSLLALKRVKRAKKIINELYELVPNDEDVEKLKKEIESLEDQVS